MTAYTDGRPLGLKALRSHPVVDTTGAGDAVAGATLARWLETGGAADGLLDALEWGLACASIAIEGIGLRALATATRAELEARVDEVRALNG